MSVRHLFRVLAIAACLACADAAPDPAPGGIVEPDPPPALREPPPHDPPTERLMHRLREHHPEEFKRLQRLREDDPAAFHGALKARLQRQRIQGRMRKDYPGMQREFERMPADERERFMKDMHEFRGRGGGHGPRRAPDPEILAIEGQIDELAASYGTTEDMSRRRKIRADVREKLGALHDLRQGERSEHIRRIEERLAKLKKSQEHREQQRESMIERRLNELLQDERPETGHR